MEPATNLKTRTKIFSRLTSYFGSLCFQGEWREEELEENHTDEGRDEGGGDDGFNRTASINGTTQQLSRGFLEDFLDR